MSANHPLSTTSTPVARHAIGRRAVIGLAILVATTAGAASLLYGSIDPGEASVRDPEAAQRRQLLAAVSSWERRAEFSASDLRDGPSVALVVFDAAAVLQTRLSAAQKLSETLQSRSDGRHRPVMAAVKVTPDDLAASLRNTQSLIGGLLERGLDGIFLDCSAVIGHVSDKVSGGGAGATLLAGIGGLIERARQVNPNFLVVLENSAELSNDPRVLRLIDGAAKDNLLFGLDGVGKSNSRTDVISSLHDLNRIKRSGRPVFVTEHLPQDAVATRTGARQMLSTLGFVGRFAAPKDAS